MLERLPIRVLGAIINDTPSKGVYRYYGYATGYQAYDEEPRPSRQIETEPVSFDLREGAAIEEEETPAEVRGNGSGSILLVEDDAGVRALAEEVLEESGYRVLSAASGSEAVEVVGEYRGEIDLLLTDVVLPGLSGPEVAERLCADHPDLRVVFMSGYTGEAIRDRLSRSREAPLLEKPFTPTALESMIRNALR